MKHTIRIETELDQKLSPGCKNMDEDYFQLKTQVRCIYFTDYTEIKNEILKTLEVLNKDINKLETCENGFDIYLRSYGLMSKTSNIFKRKFFCEEKKAKKIIGRDFLRSKDRYKYFLSINIINLKRNDTIEVKGRQYNINSIKNQDIFVSDIVSHKKEAFKYKLIKDYLKIIKND